MAVGHIFVYGEIGTRTGQVSQKLVKEQIDKSAESYVVHIFSPGGDVFEGYGIYNAIRNDTNGKSVVTHIEGLCASIATLIAAAGQKIIMNRTGQFMIHNPHITDLKGDANQLRSVANQLDQIKSILINVYKSRTGLSDEKLWDLYDKETYLTADEAVTMGFIDESVDAIKAVARIDQTKFTMKESILKQITNFFKAAPEKAQRILAQMTETLSDGRVIVVMTEDEDWTGKQVVLEDGSPLPSGEYEMSSGKKLIVSEGVISEVQDAPTPTDQNTEEEMNKIKELETQLAEAKAALDKANATQAAAEAQITTAEAKAAKFEAKYEALSGDHLKLKEELGKTQGDNTPEKKGPVLKNGQQPVDGMGDFALEFYKNRNLIK